MEFPRYVFQTVDGRSQQYLLVVDAHDYAAAIKAGWFHEPQMAPAPRPVRVLDAEKPYRAPTRADLEATAKALGIKFDGRTADATLINKIDEAKTANGV
jgi:hypothetical protein